MDKIRKPAVAGMFYPASARQLNEDLDRMLENNGISLGAENILGLVVPHAGYLYSGKTAAAAFRQLKNKKYSTVIVISPSHREYFQGACVYAGSAYLTPLGEIPVNTLMREKLTANTDYMIFTGERGHGQEHSLEVELPFLQKVLGEFSLVPIVMGDQKKLYVDKLAEKLAETIDDKTLIVASSDLSHFYSKERANELDSIVERNIINSDPDTLMEDLERRTCEACGGGPIAVLLKTAKLLGRDKTRITARSDSGDVTGDNTEVVGYISAVVYG